MILRLVGPGHVATNNFRRLIRTVSDSSGYIVFGDQITEHTTYTQDADY